MSAVLSRYTVDVVAVGETALRIEVLTMHRRPGRPPATLVGVRLAAPVAAVSIRLGARGVRRLIAALEQAAADAFGHDDDVEEPDEGRDRRHPRARVAAPLTSHRPGVPRGKVAP